MNTAAVSISAPMPTKAKRRPLTLSASLALVILIIVLLAAVLAPVISPFDPTAQELSNRLKPPLARSQNGTIFWLGTDSLGRDILSRLLYGAQISLVIALTATAGQLVVGTLLGLIAGFRRGVWDAVIMRVTDIQLTIPFLALAIAVAAVLGSSLLNVILILVITSWVYFAKVVRGEVLVVRERVYVEAARSLGMSDWRLLLRHILPNVSNSIIVLASFQVSRMILSEATLSFLGLGVQPPTPTWGNMVADGRNFVSAAWWIATLPGLAITVLVLGVNLLGNWLRDRLDPLRSRRL
ncbi:MAG: ABC transporter permease [Chloroflexi bacterium]|nr:ABC transporter permease [Chloroflexota bacterium]